MQTWFIIGIVVVLIIIIIVATDKDPTDEIRHSFQDMKANKRQPKPTPSTTPRQESHSNLSFPCVKTMVVKSTNYVLRKRSQLQGALT